MTKRTFPALHAPAPLHKGPKSKGPSALDVLRKRQAAPGLCVPTGPAAMAVLQATTSLTPAGAPGLFDFLATGRVLDWGWSILFDSEAKGDRRAEIIRTSDDLAALPPQLLVDAVDFKPKAAALTSRGEIDRHCKGLILRPVWRLGPGYAIEDAMPTLSSALGFGLASHVEALDRLRIKCPDIFVAIIEDETERVASLIESHADLDRRRNLTCTAVRHWLLNRALHLQRGAAYIASSRQAAIPGPLQSICGRGDTTVVAAKEWFYTFGRATGEHLCNFVTGLNAPQKPQSLPVELLNVALSNHLNFQIPKHATVDLSRALTPHAPWLMARLRHIARMVEKVSDRTARDQLRLHRQAKVADPMTSRITLFEHWHFGLSPAAVLVLLVRRLFDAVAICRAVENEPEKFDQIINRKSVKASPKVKQVKEIMRELAAEVMGDWAPKLENTAVAFKLADAFLADTLPRSSEARQFFAKFDPLGSAAVSPR